MKVYQKNSWALEMTLWLKHSPHKLEDLSSALQNPYKILGGLGGSSLIAALEGGRLQILKEGCLPRLAILVTSGFDQETLPR